MDTHFVADCLTRSLLLHLRVAQTRVGDVSLPVVVAVQTAAVQLNTREEDERNGRVIDQSQYQEEFWFEN